MTTIRRSIAGWSAVLGLVFAFLAQPVIAQDLEDPRNILRERTARYWHELDRQDDQVGAEHNPTGNPIGGGEGYSDIITSGDYTVRTYEGLRETLEKAQPGEVVYVPGDAVIEFSNREPLAIPSEVTLASNRGHSGSKGALLFSNALDTDMMLAASGDYIRITGLRIRGPFDLTWRVPLGSDGVEIEGFGAELDNCEVSAFSHAAISVDDDAGRAYIHHNHIHHNQRNGLGYGISSSGTDLLYEANFFNYNRHHIASGGSPGSAYEARYNISGPHSTNHLFDMHGGVDRGDRTPIAGDWLHIHHNTFESEDQSVHIRGVPSQGAWMHQNWMVNAHRDDMLEVDDNGYLYENAVGKDKSPYPGDNQ